MADLKIAQDKVNEILKVRLQGGLYYSQAQNNQDFETFERKIAFK